MRHMLATIVAVAGLTAPVYAADLGGNCCADLEERVASLESGTASKGNKKMSVQIFGTVNQAVLWMDGLLADQDKNVVGNSADPTRFGLRGEAKINKENSAGFLIEIGVDPKPALPILQDQVTVRNAALWIENKTLGRVTVGHTSMSTDYITRLTTANTDHVAPMLSLAPLSTAYLFSLDLPFNNLRRDLARWDSPTFAGFVISASVANGDTPLGIGFNSDHAFDVALRYAGEFSGFRLVAGVGYRDENYTLTTLNPLPIVRDKVVSGSGSVMHMGTGLFVSGAFGRVERELIFGGNDTLNWHAQAGWQRNVTKLGATTVFAEYGQMQIDNAGIDPKMWGFGVNQNIESAALDLFAGFRQYDLDITGADKLNVGLAGIRIRF